MILIGIAGQKYNGKDTIADYLVSTYGFIKISFADKLKEMCKVLFNFTDEQLYGSQKETIDNYWNIAPRDVFQYFGTDIMRNDIKKILPSIENDFWIKCTFKQIDNFIKENNNCKIVIADVRFPNEVNAIKSYNGHIIRVIRPSIQNDDFHESESQIPFLNVDYEIINDNNINELYKKIDNILQLYIRH
jgi:uridine kinase